MKTIVDCERDLYKGKHKWEQVGIVNIDDFTRVLWCIECGAVGVRSPFEHIRKARVIHRVQEK